MNIIKGIFIFLMGIYAFAKIVDGVDNKYTNNKDKIVNLIEMVVSIACIFFIYKF